MLLTRARSTYSCGSSDSRVLIEPAGIWHHSEGDEETVAAPDLTHDIHPCLRAANDSSHGTTSTILVLSARTIHAIAAWQSRSPVFNDHARGRPDTIFGPRKLTE